MLFPPHIDKIVAMLAQLPTHNFGVHRLSLGLDPYVTSESYPVKAYRCKRRSCPFKSQELQKEMPHPHPPHTHTTPTTKAMLPSPSKVISIDNNTNSPEPAAGNCQMPIQKKAPLCTLSQPTQRTPLLPMPPAPARQHIRKALIPRPPSCSNSQFQQKQYLSGPYSTSNNKQHQPLLPSPPYHHQRPVITRLPLHTKRHYSLHCHISQSSY